MIDFGESDKMAKISEKIDKSDAYKGFYRDISFFIQEFLHLFVIYPYFHYRYIFFFLLKNKCSVKYFKLSASLENIDCLLCRGLRPPSKMGFSAYDTKLYLMMMMFYFWKSS